jgi:hypothetical protein
MPSKKGPLVLAILILAVGIGWLLAAARLGGTIH